MEHRAMSGSDAEKKLNEAYAALSDWLNRYSEEDTEDAQ